MSLGSGSRPPTAQPGQKFIVLRCPFCGRKVKEQEWYSAEKMLPPGKQTFGSTIKCPKCSITTRY